MARSLAQQEEYRMRDGDAAGREPGTEAGRRLLGLGTLVIPPDGQWSPGLADEILAIEAEARQQGREREALDVGLLAKALEVVDDEGLLPSLHAEDVVREYERLRAGTQQGTG